jgi:hypothetical protein
MHLNKEEVARLNNRELVAFARVILDESHSRRGAFGKARNYWGKQIIPVIITALALFALYLWVLIGWQVAIVLFGALALQQWHAAGVNKRIDALIDILELASIANRERELPAGARPQPGDRKQAEPVVPHRL